MGRASTKKHIVTPDNLDLDPPIELDAPTRATTTQGIVEKREKTKREQYDKALTLPVSEELHREVEDLARKYQKSRTVLKERITANSVYRSLLTVGVELLKEREGWEGVVNNERDLLTRVRKVLTS